MASNQIEHFQVSFIKRNARKRGPTSSEDWNDSFDELARDWAALYDQWNNRLVPLLDLIPNGLDDADIDAYANGLDGRTLYVNSEATNILDSTYYNSTDVRPNTLYEQFVALYTYVNTIKAELEGDIAIVAPPASDILLTNVLYNSGLETDVDSALTEVMTKVNSFYGTSTFLPLAGGSMTGTLNMTNAPTTKITLTTGVSIFLGSGSPEGVVSASVGSLFLRTDGGAATTLWVKTSGSGAAGWTGK